MVGTAAPTPTTCNYNRDQLQLIRTSDSIRKKELSFPEFVEGEKVYIVFLVISCALGEEKTET